MEENDWKKEQSTEIEVLKAIFSDDIEEIEPEQKFKIRITASHENEKWTKLSLFLQIEFVEDYPYKHPPIIKILPDCEIHDEQIKDLEYVLQNNAKEYIGTPMVHRLIDDVKNWVTQESEILRTMFSVKANKTEKKLVYLPNELWLQIFGYLNPDCLAITALVNHHWRSLSLELRLWEPIYTKYYGKLPNKLHISEDNLENYRHAFFERKRAEKRINKKIFEADTLPQRFGTILSFNTYHDLIAVSFTSGAVKAFDITKMQTSENVSIVQSPCKEAAITHIEVSEKLILGGSEDGINIWKAPNYELASTYTNFGSHGLLLNEQNNIFIHDNKRGFITATDLTTGKDVNNFEYLMNCIDFSGNSRILASSSNTVIRLFDLRSEKLIAVSENYGLPVRSMKFNVDLNY